MANWFNEIGSVHFIKEKFWQVFTSSFSSSADVKRFSQAAAGFPTTAAQAASGLNVSFLTNTSAYIYIRKYLLHSTWVVEHSSTLLTTSKKVMQNIWYCRVISMAFLWNGFRFAPLCFQTPEKKGKNKIENKFNH